MGSYGLIKIRCNDLESFDPFNDSCLFGCRNVEVKVKVSSQLNFKLKGEYFRVRGNLLKLPLFAGVYLFCKGLAEGTD